jgi:hypothetical protein
VWVAIVRARLQLERDSLPYFTDLLLLRLSIARQSLNVIRDSPPTEQAVDRPLSYAGIQQIVHIDPPIVTNPTATMDRAPAAATRRSIISLSVSLTSVRHRKSSSVADLLSRFRLAPAPISVQTSCKLAPQVSSLRAAELRSPGCAGGLSAKAVGSQLSCDRRAASDLLQSSS